MKSIKSLISHLLMDMFALFVLSHLMTGINFDDIRSVFWTAILLGLINFLVMPILKFFTWPLNFVTLGIFPLILNGAVFIFISKLVPGFQVNDWLSAIVGSVALGVITYLLNHFVKGKK